MIPTKALAGFFNETEAHSEEVVNEEVAVSIRKSGKDEYQLIIDDGNNERWYQLGTIELNTLIVGLEHAKEWKY